MKQRIYASIIAAFALFSAFLITGNSDLPEKTLAKLTQYLQQTPQEKVYLHLDKPYYMAGETMWFKGYLFDATLHNLDSVSRVLYVDLIDPSVGKVLIHNVLPCEGAMTDGSFKLPDSLVEKTYTVRAYTNYMKNFSEDWFFQKPVKIWQKKTEPRGDYKALTDVADCQFFPEGGYLINDVETRLAFKAVNAAGKGIDFEGVVFENGVDTVLAFKSIHLGMGNFYFKPQIGKNYVVKIKKADGTEGVFSLPEAQAQGLTLAVDNTTSKTNIKVFINNTQPQTADKAGELFIIAHQRGIPCFSVKTPNTKKAIAVNIPRATIPDDGIVQITLFDAEGQPRCERLVFVQQNKQINLKITPDKAEYAPREKVTLTVEATDSLGKPVVGNFSLAATDGTQVLNEKYAENLMSYLLLSSDLNGKDAILRGVVEDPAYYFDKSIKTASRDLDLLMMTQGWRRFKWHDILTEQTIKPKFLIEQGLSVTGKVLRPSGKISKNVNVTLLIGGDKNPTIMVATADTAGVFGFYNLNFFDTTKIFVQAVKERGGRNLDIIADNSGLAAKVLVTKVPFNTMAFDATAFADFLKTTKETLDFERKLQLNKEKMLETVEIKAKRIIAVDDRRLYGTPSNSIDMTKENCGSFFSILDVIRGRVAGVQVNGSGLDVSVVIRGGSSVGFRLDGMPVDIETIATIPPCDVEAVDILKGADAAIFGLNGGDGVIAILTKRGNPDYDYSNDPSPAGIIVQRRNGYTARRAFYAPRYDESKAEHEFKDFRSTLHWQPYVQTDANGKATVTFWNSDAKTKIQVVAEGVSKTGRIGVTSCTYLVK
jgi:TonB-dependent Receptor Plug Domain